LNKKRNLFPGEAIYIWKSGELGSYVQRERKAEAVK
jgi:hypothetical protein